MNLARVRLQARESLANVGHQKIHDKHKRSLSATDTSQHSTTRCVCVCACVNHCTSQTACWSWSWSLECQLLLADHHNSLSQSKCDWPETDCFARDIPNGWAVPWMSVGARARQAGGQAGGQLIGERVRVFINVFMEVLF